MYRCDYITMRPETASCRRVLLNDNNAFPVTAASWRINVELRENLGCLAYIEQQMIKSCEDTMERDGESRLILGLESFYNYNEKGEKITPAAKELTIHADEPLLVEVARNKIPLKIKVSGKAVLNWVSSNR
jgi:hypothetical protein